MQFLLDLLGMLFKGALEVITHEVIDLAQRPDTVAPDPVPVLAPTAVVSVTDDDLVSRFNRLSHKA